MSEQSKYWSELTTLKRDAIYISLFAEKTENFDRFIECTKAVAASSAIGAWAVFQAFPFVWGTVVAASQVFTAVQTFLPYKRRLKALTGLSLDLGTLAITAEADWFNVANGTMTDEQIHKLRMALKRKIHDATKAHFGGGYLTSQSQLVAIADQAASDYFSIYTEHPEGTGAGGSDE